MIASWVTDDSARYVPAQTSTDGDVLASFRLLLFDLSQDTKKNLLDLHLLDNFESKVRSDFDGDASPQYCRAVRFNQDIWFTCHVLDFVRSMSNMAVRK